jgi:hypothetical protein
MSRITIQIEADAESPGDFQVVLIEGNGAATAAPLAAASLICNVGAGILMRPADIVESVSGANAVTRQGQEFVAIGAAMYDWLLPAGNREGRLIDNGVTAGEQLCNFLLHRLLKNQVWWDLERTLQVTGRARDLVRFYRQVAAVTLTGRIVAAGTSVSSSCAFAEPTFRKVFSEHLRDTVGIPTHLLDELYRFSYRAVVAASEEPTKAIQRKCREWSSTSHSRCYICGASWILKRRTR